MVLHNIFYFFFLRREKIAPVSVPSLCFPPGVVKRRTRVTARIQSFLNFITSGVPFPVTLLDKGTEDCFPRLRLSCDFEVSDKRTWIVHAFITIFSFMTVMVFEFQVVQVLVDSMRTKILDRLTIINEGTPGFGTLFSVGNIRTNIPGWCRTVTRFLQRFLPWTHSDDNHVNIPCLCSFP